MLKSEMRETIQEMEGQLLDYEERNRELLGDIRKLKEVQQKYKAQTMKVEEARHSIQAILCVTCADVVPMDIRWRINEDRERENKEPIEFAQFPEIHSALTLISNILQEPMEVKSRLGY